ncbi:tRNA (guanine(10)-N(2))-dimethyltransferase [Methanolobus bombayensis]|uniref:tRNA (guanine(10)-N(2))-dimethyltransferase n=1 Tax=Methanolobus bombayensis TaxID=38023 RepID=UPI001AE920D0|nr:tRNA (guanine(10)-N(2))-dimethyltransferase [Methanolobus bombayensis]MBP1910007.1 tRNA (guanine26-N2/guanine27-N2)-dimethyltransferase [Methanolobus bombayensis]
MKVRSVKEGDTEVLVPVPEEGANFAPSAAPVFFNPVMEMNRDISIAATSAFLKRMEPDPEKKITYVDALSASGVRGLRVSNEIGIHTTLNDWSEDAFELIKQNIEELDIGDHTFSSHKNANVLLHEKHFNIVDLDPFGTPAPFLAAAARSVINLLEVTATDTAPLCGAHLNSGIRKYAAVPFNNEYHSEMGVRILLGKIARELSMYDKAMVPLLSHATRHYVRSYLNIRRGAKQADRMLKKLGFISHCECGHREAVYGLAVHIDDTCSLCGKKNTIAGPLWLGELHDPQFCNETIEELEMRNCGTKEMSIKMLEFCRDELDIPMFYDQHLICKKLGVSASAIDTLITELRKNGFNASRTHFSGTSFKTDAKLPDVERLIIDIR